jgi:hypothetical protein
LTHETAEKEEETSEKDEIYYELIRKLRRLNARPPPKIMRKGRLVRPKIRTDRSLPLKIIYFLYRLGHPTQFRPTMTYLYEILDADHEAVFRQIKMLKEKGFLTVPGSSRPGKMGRFPQLTTKGGEAGRFLDVKFVRKKELKGYNIHWLPRGDLALLLTRAGLIDKRLKAWLVP